MRMTEKEFKDLFPVLAEDLPNVKRKRKIPAEYIPTEHEEQVAFIKHVHAHYDEDISFVGDVFFSVPNGIIAGGRNKFAVLSKFFAEGWKNGVSDILYLQARGIYGGLAIEMKRSNRRKEKDGGMSKAEIAFQKAARKIHWLAVTCYTGDEAITVFRNYMNLTPLVAVSDEDEVFGLNWFNGE